jgi:hypothetical protein
VPDNLYESLTGAERHRGRRVFRIDRPEKGQGERTAGKTARGSGGAATLSILARCGTASQHGEDRPTLDSTLDHDSPLVFNAPGGDSTGLSASGRQRLKRSRIRWLRNSVLVGSGPSFSGSHCPARMGHRHATLSQVPAPLHRTGRAGFPHPTLQSSSSDGLRRNLAGGSPFRTLPP